MNKMKLEKIIVKDEREGAGITRYGTSSYRAIGFNIIAETEEDKKLIKDFYVLYEDTNGYIEVDLGKKGESFSEKENIKFYIYKSW